MSSFKSYLRTYFLIVLSILFAIAIFNFVVDPYDIFRVVEIAGFNQEKPYSDVGGLSRVKAIDLAKGNYDTIILGTSRVFWGLDPENPAFGSRNVYNAGILSASSYQIDKVFEYARQHLKLKTVVLGLDINAFDARRPWVLPDQDFNQSAFVSKLPLLDNLKTLFSYDTLNYASETIKFNRQGKKFDKYTSRGFIKPESFHLDRNQNFQLVANKILSNQEPTKFSYRRATMQFLIDIVEACDRNNIELKLFIEPTHAIMQEWVERSGNLPTVERWKRALVLIVTRFAPHNDGSLALWDFSGFNSINTEKVPENPRQKMHWYIDPVHYTKETGDLMIKRIFNYSSRSQQIPNDFGVLINEQNIDAHLKSLRAGGK